MPLRRREIRTLLVQSLFQHEFTNDTFSRESLRKIYTNIAKEYAPKVINDSYALQLIDTLVSKQKDIDMVIERASTNWKLEKMGVIDRSIIRLGVCELLFSDKESTPGRVVINEAIELAKLFLTEKGSKFVNGVLDAIYKEINKINVGSEVRTNKSPPKIKKSVGALIFKKEEGEGLMFAMVHDVFNKWTLPKGQVNRGELKEDAIKRVIKDKLAAVITIVDELGVNSFIAHSPEGAILKEVNYFLAQTETPVLQLAELEGLREVKWFSADEIKRLSTYKDIKTMIYTTVDKVENEYANG